MKLYISNEKIIDSSFIPYIILQIQSYISQHINKDTLIKWDAYLEKNGEELFNGVYKNLTAYEIISLGIDNIGAKKTSMGVEISVQNNKKPNQIFAKLYDVCMLINYGNLSIDGTFLFSNAFEYFGRNINEILVKYIGSVDTVKQQ